VCVYACVCVCRCVCICLEPILPPIFFILICTGFTTCTPIWSTTAGSYKNDFEGNTCGSLGTQMIVTEQLLMPSNCFSGSNGVACKKSNGVNMDGCRRVRILECAAPGGSCTDECSAGAKVCLTATSNKECGGTGCPTQARTWTTFNCKPETECREAGFCDSTPLIGSNDCEFGAYKVAGTPCTGGVCTGTTNLCDTSACVDACTPATTRCSTNIRQTCINGCPGTSLFTISLCLL
jgi:hypothetical protein